MADSKHDEGFKVIDRRLFTESGELRQEVVEQERRDEEIARKAPAPSPKPVQDSDRKSADERLPSGASDNANASAVAGAGAGDAAVSKSDSVPSSRNFQMLVDFLTRNAAAMLGGMADPQTGQAFVDLEGARELIDMLDVLREKTKGNLSKEDDQLLIEVLGSLKLTFMEISRAATEQMAKKAKAKS